MKVFLDTNVFLEYLCGRQNALIVRELLDLLEDKGCDVLLSSSSFCTIAYYVELSLKERGVHKPDKTIRTRNILNTVLQIATIVDINHKSAIVATNDLSFTDFEDSMQYQCALNNNCDVILTFNVKDFRNADTTMISVMTPEVFVQKYGK